MTQLNLLQSELREADFDEDETRLVILTLKVSTTAMNIIQFS